MGLKVELDSITHTHLKRFIKYLKTKGYHERDTDFLVLTDNEMIAQYVAWLEAGEPEN